MSKDTRAAAPAATSKRTLVYESAITNRVQQFGNIAQVFSSYASRTAPNEKPFARGVNSIQLFNDGTRWWSSASSGTKKPLRIPSHQT